MRYSPVFQPLSEYELREYSVLNLTDIKTQKKNCIVLRTQGSVAKLRMEGNF